MSLHPVSKSIPEDLDPRYYARNGRVPNAALAQALARGLGHVIAFRTKCVMAWSQAINELSTIAPSAGDNDFLHGRFHAGIGAKKIVFDVGLAQTSSHTDPYVYAKVTPSGGSTTDTDEFHYGGVTTAPDNTVDEFGRGQIVYDLPAHNTTYEWALHVVDYARVVWCCVYVVHGSPVDTDDGALAPDVTVGSPLTDQWHEDALTLSTDLWKYNAAHLISWTKGQVSSETTTDTSFKNWLDGSTVGIVSSLDPGWKLDTRYHRTLSGPWIPVVLAARGRMQSAVNTGTIRLSDGSGGADDIELEITGTTSQWFAVSGVISANIKDYVIEAKVDAGTMELDAITVYEYGDTLVGAPAPIEGWGSLQWGQGGWGS